MNVYFSVVQRIIKDKTSVQLLAVTIVTCFINLTLGWFFIGALLTTFVGAFVLSAFLQHNDEAKRKLQDITTSILSLTLKDDVKSADVGIDKELDTAIESFFSRIINTFISSWYLNVTQDETFVWTVKVEIAEAVRKIEARLMNVDIPLLISNKLLPVIYSHFDVLERIFQKEKSPHDQVAAYIDHENPIHPAVFSRRSEVEYLRFLSKNLLRILSSTKNYDCEVLQHLVQEVLTCSVLLPLTDIISDPATINLLVILATNPREKETMAKPVEKKVVLLENFVKRFKMNLTDDEETDDNEEQFIDGNFLKDQNKLYSFMQHLKGKSNSDIELLKFYLDVEHLNTELEKPSVVCDPVKLTELQRKSEQLLTFYQTNLFKDDGSTQKPDDLLKSHDHARRALEAKWRNDFYKSGEYFELIYGGKETFAEVPEQFHSHDSPDSMHQPKFSSKFKNVMTIRPVEGLEATEIPIWDAIDHPLGQSSYYNSVAVKLRKERGQDLDSFMQTFFHSIEQEADIGEDIASTQTQEEAKGRLKKKLTQGNELYKNLFDISGQTPVNVSSIIPTIKSSVDSAIYFLASILKVHKILLRLFIGFVRILPDADKIIHGLLSKFLRSVVNEPILAKLITELEEKVFDPAPTIVPSNEELTKRRQLAATRIANVNSNLTQTLSYLQNPLLNKNLVYCLIDVITLELFPELQLNLDAKD